MGVNTAQKLINISVCAKTTDNTTLNADRQRCCSRIAAVIYGDWCLLTLPILHCAANCDNMLYTAVGVAVGISHLSSHPYVHNHYVTQ